ncbi:MAG TPA: hypothetical protein VK357_16520 [Rubrobacteraceae bacterium]|nr:hypothetical protein [Rubrobacteraceae bacterium]
MYETILFEKDGFYEYLRLVVIHRRASEERVRQGPLAYPPGEGAGEDSEGGVNSRT